MDIVANDKAIKEILSQENDQMLMIFFDDDIAEDYEEKYKEWQENENS